MRKIGRCTINSSNGVIDSYMIAWYQEGIITRFDLASNPSEYDPMMCTGVVASYYEEGDSLYYGNKELVDTVLATINTVSLAPIPVKNNIDASSGIIEMKRVKENNELYYEIITINGKASSEKFNTTTVTIDFPSMSQESMYACKPLVFSMYQIYSKALGDLSSMLITSTSDFFTLDELRRIHPGELDHIYEYDYHYVESLSHAFEMIYRFKEEAILRNDLVAIDCETTGLDMDIFGDDCLTGVVLGFSTDNSVYFPFRQERSEYNLPMWFLSVIVEVVNSLPKTIRVAMYNGKMEILSFWKDDADYIKYCEYAKSWKDNGTHNIFEGQSYIDQDCTEYLTNKHYIHWKETNRANEKLTIRMDVDGFHISMKSSSDRGPGLHSLKTHAQRVTKRFWLELKEIFKGEIKFNRLPPDLITVYACPDAPNTIRVVKDLESRFPAASLEVLRLENELTYVKAENEFFGLPADIKVLESLISECITKRDILEKRFKEIHRTSKNIRSSKVKADIFYNVLKADVIIRTETGAPSGSGDALNEILKTGVLSKNEIASISKVPSIVMYKRSDGTFSTGESLNKEDKFYLDNKTKQDDGTLLIEPIEIVSGKDLISNRYPSLIILSKFNDCCKELSSLNRLKKKNHKGRISFYIISDLTASDRQASDAHQYSDTMKEVVRADSKHHNFISCDYKQVELRVMSFLSGIKQLTEQMHDPENDIHRLTVSIIDGTPLCDISEEERKVKKSVNFGVVYGMTEYGLAFQNIGARFTEEDLAKYAKQILDYYNIFPELKKFFANSEEELMTYGQVKTSFGFIRRAQWVLDPSATKKEIRDAKKACNNTKFQSFAATLLKLAETHLREYIIMKGWDKKVDCDGVMLPLVRLIVSAHDEVLLSSHKSLPLPEVFEMLKTCMEINIKGAPPFFASPGVADSWFLAKQDEYECPIALRDLAIREYKDNKVDIFANRVYLDVLKEFRLKEIMLYIDGLFDKYITTEEVILHVKHPTLTHEIISTLLTTDERKPLSHRERVAKAINNYVAMKKDNNFVLETKINDIDIEAMNQSSNIQEYIRFDGHGEMVIEKSVDDLGDDIDEIPDMSAVEQYDNKISIIDREYIIYMMDTCMLDMSSLYGTSVAEQIHQDLYKLSLKTPIDQQKYDVVYLIGKETARPGFKLPYNPDIINNMIRLQVVKKGVV